MMKTDEIQAFNTSLRGRTLEELEALHAMCPDWDMRSWIRIAALNERHGTAVYERMLAFAQQRREEQAS